MFPSILNVLEDEAQETPFGCGYSCELALLPISPCFKSLFLQLVVLLEGHGSQEVGFSWRIRSLR